MNEDIHGASTLSTGLSSLCDEADKSSSPKASIPSAGDTFEVVYPFVRDTYWAFDDEGGSERETWKPGIAYRNCGPEDTEAFADAEGCARFTVVAAFKPGRYPTRVFYTRKFVTPEGREFGKSRLHIGSLEKFRRLVAGFRIPYGLGDNPPPQSRYGGLSSARAMFEELLAAASGTEARSGETEGLDPKDDGPVAKGETPITSANPQVSNPGVNNES